MGVDDRGTDARTSSGAGTRERRPDHFGRRTRARWTCDRRRTYKAGSFLVTHVPDPRRDLLTAERLTAKSADASGMVWWTGEIGSSGELCQAIDRNELFLQ